MSWLFSVINNKREGQRREQQNKNKDDGCNNSNNIVVQIENGQKQEEIREEGINNNVNGLNGQHAKLTNFSLWFATVPEIRMEALRFLDLRNIQRLKMVCLNVKFFVDFNEEQWPGNGFEELRIGIKFQFTIERLFNGAISIEVQATAENCPVKYLKLVDTNIVLDKYYCQMNCDEDKCKCNLHLCGQYRLFFFNRPLIFVRPGIRLFLTMPLEIQQNNLRWVMGWLLYLAHEWKFKRRIQVPNTRRQLRWPTTILLRKFVRKMKDKELDNFNSKFLSWQ